MSPLILRVGWFRCSTLGVNDGTGISTGTAPADSPAERRSETRTIKVLDINDKGRVFLANG